LPFPARHLAKPSTLAIAQGSILASDKTILELHRTLRRPKLARYFSRAEQDAFLAVFASEVTIVEVTIRISLCRDPRDDKFLELAVAGGASRLTAGDRDLLTLHRFRDTRIMAPAALLDEFASRGQ
jgi:putative PIN family toxin of toxin-antitoxin system